MWLLRVDHLVVGALLASSANFLAVLITVGLISPVLACFLLGFQNLILLIFSHFY
jgi:hypothetical protein